MPKPTINNVSERLQRAQRRVGRLILEARAASPLTLTDACAQVQIGPTRLSNLENGHMSPTLAELENMRRVLHLDVAAVMACYAPAPPRIRDRSTKKKPQATAGVAAAA